MDKVSVTITVFFEEAFWVGVIELKDANTLSVCKVIFGSEPSAKEVLDYIDRRFTTLQFSPVARIEAKTITKGNPKRKQRELKKQMERSISTKSQKLLTLQYLQSKEATKQKHKRYKEEVEKRVFALKQQKRKEKHRGH